MVLEFVRNLVGFSTPPAPSVSLEFAHSEVRDDLFAGTPPLAATKVLLSDFASSGNSEPKNRRLMILDIKRAFLYGTMEENIVIHLPEEDPKHGQGFYGKLRKAMYGTRAAPQAWQGVVKNTMSSLGFQRSLKYPCVYLHVKKELKVVTHVDDFICSGQRKQLEWLREELGKEFAMTHEILGPADDEVKMAKYLGRTISWTRSGIEYKGDANHAKILLEEWDLEEGRAVVTPGVADEKAHRDDETNIQPLDRDASRVYRRTAARINYMAQDRADLSFTAKELSRAMANPTEGDVVRLKRTLRYLKGKMEAVQEFKWQERPATLLLAPTATGPAARRLGNRRVAG